MGILAGVSLLYGWVANFSIFFRWPTTARVLWILAPWVPFAVLLFQPGPAPAPAPLSLLYFYPWAAGIGLVHLADIAAPNQGTPAALNAFIRR